MPFELTIVTPEGQSYQGSVERVVLPGREGEFGVLTNHERFLAPLRVGAVEIITEGEALYAAVADGFAEVDGESVTVLVDSCELEHEIDAARADAAVAAAQQYLDKAAGDEDPERYRHYEGELERARTRVAVSRRKRQ
ncbi:MAG: ATP synthase F1 subunit epsilon [Myxococcales bacterium]|jgi:F-type H+-transporting ATPase subunit epsilon|nr:ATP synthase F1 subunit epsilon [Myxococcales bacterium]MCH8891587.1 ATP synthase F1 subunit epsilon [Myxococcales bacterium]